MRALTHVIYETHEINRKFNYQLSQERKIPGPNKNEVANGWLMMMLYIDMVHKNVVTNIGKRAEKQGKSGVYFFTKMIKRDVLFYW